MPRQVAPALALAALLAATLPHPAPAAGKVSVAYSFKANPDGAYPDGLTLLGHDFYGTTYNGGINAAGTVFKVTPQGKETLLYTFGQIGGGDGRQPPAGVVAVNNTLYGTTVAGGTADTGTVFAVTPQGAETVLHSFTGGTDGAEPIAGLIAVTGMLYGTTSAGGGSAQCNGGCGTVFSITPGGQEKVLYAFAGGQQDGAAPYAPLIHSGGALYGVTRNGGKYGLGTVFKLTPDGHESILYSFRGSPADGAYPVGALAELNGDLYGTTEFGGTDQCSGGCGIVFKISKTGTETVLHTFNGNNGDGYHTLNGLNVINGRLYGTTGLGGPANSGVLYTITPAGHETILASFRGGPSVTGPNPQLIPSGGLLWGTSFYGGTFCIPSGGCGTLFTFKP